VNESNRPLICGVDEAPRFLLPAAGECSASGRVVFKPGTRGSHAYRGVERLAVTQSSATIVLARSPRVAGGALVGAAQVVYHDPRVRRSDRHRRCSGSPLALGLNLGVRTTYVGTVLTPLPQPLAIRGVSDSVLGPILFDTTSCLFSGYDVLVALIWFVFIEQGVADPAADG